MNITLNPLRKAPDSLWCPSGEDPKGHLSSSGLSPLCFALLCLAELPAAAFLPAVRSNRCTDLLPSCPQQSFRPTQHINLPAQKYIPRQPRDHIKKAPSRVPFCLGKMVRSDRLECGRKSEVKEKPEVRLGSSLLPGGKSGQLRLERVCLITRKRLPAPRGCLQPGSRSKRDFLRKRRNGAQSIPVWDRRSVQIGWDAGANFGQKKRAGARLGSRPLHGAADGGRTRTVSLPRDFKSRVSANFTTAADTSIQ